MATEARGGESETPQAVWERFQGDLARGRYDDAHKLFSPQSRDVFPLKAFVRDYHPLSRAREIVLSPQERTDLAIRGDWAELALAVAGEGGVARVTVCLAREDGRWRLVAAAREGMERIEAETRGALRRLAPAIGHPELPSLLRRLNDAALEDEAPYRFRIDAGHIVADPELSGLRRFRVDENGNVRAAAVDGAGLRASAPSSGEDLRALAPPKTGSGLPPPTNFTPPDRVTPSGRETSP